MSQRRKGRDRGRGGGGGPAGSLPFRERGNGGRPVVPGPAPSSTCVPFSFFFKFRLSLLHKQLRPFRCRPCRSERARSRGEAGLWQPAASPQAQAGKGRRRRGFPLPEGHWHTSHCHRRSPPQGGELNVRFGEERVAPQRFLGKKQGQRQRREFQENKSSVRMYLPTNPPSWLGNVKIPPVALCTLPADFRARLIALLRSLSDVTH